MLGSDALCFSFNNQTSDDRLVYLPSQRGLNRKNGHSSDVPDRTGWYTKPRPGSWCIDVRRPPPGTI